MPQVISEIEQRVLAELLEGLPLKELGQTLSLSDTNVRFGINKLKWRDQAETLDELLAKARREFKGE